MPIQFLDQRISVISQGSSIAIPAALPALLVGDIGLQTVGVLPGNASNVRVELNAMIIVDSLSAADSYRIQISREGTPIFTADYTGADLESVNPPSYTVTDFPPAAQVLTGQIRYTFSIVQTSGAATGIVQGAFFGGSAAAGNS
ncbi:hypothetical protein [Peribacillus frigoritolerans]|uniref:hypothetical protein n=1 Tax=Peribacillus frigoritolerans TaxID=450367 RepID=UPI0034296DF7